MAKTYRVSGMTCGGCARSVERAIKEATPGVSVVIELDSGTVTIDGPAAAEAVAKAVEDAGFGFGGAVGY